LRSVWNAWPKSAIGLLVWRARMRRLAAVVVALIAGAFAAAASAAPADFAYNILAPGQFGGLPTTPNSTDQISLYDALTPLRGNVTTSDIQRLYKPENFQPNGATRS